MVSSKVFADVLTNCSTMFNFYYKYYSSIPRNLSINAQYTSKANQTPRHPAKSLRRQHNLAQHPKIQSIIEHRPARTGALAAAHRPVGR